MCNHGWVSHNTSCYLVKHELTTWPDAKVICDVVSAKLVEIETSEENNFLKGLLRENNLHSAWIGLEDFVAEGEFVWSSSGQLAEYKNWESGEPNDFRREQDCGTLLSSGQWHDNNCEIKFPFICEAP
ncbi:hypothetical protein BaRGS_00025051 [Batillaria attramentaria]|uniref:C-type lectin domain-containing protein n=1 Tax=Batillaria attramentaria TaxID=370345 RepID=A0ABD0K9E7_9CAEN